MGRKEQQHENYLKENISLVQKLKGNVKAMNEYRKLFNSLCDNCRQKVVRNPRMKPEEYCPVCQDRVNARMERVKEMLS